MSVVVAVDGPAGSGKSSVSRAVADRLGYAYLDTGAYYRAVAWYGLETGADLGDPAAVADLVARADVHESLDPRQRRVHVGGTDVTDAIRLPAVTAVVGRVATVPAARRLLNERFRDIIARTEPGIVVEGRDITTVVAPDADARILLTAAPEARAGRRAAELAALGEAADAADVLAAIRARDEKDSTMVEFLRAAAGVTTVDSTELDFDATVDAVVDVIRSARPGAERPTEEQR